MSTPVSNDAIAAAREQAADHLADDEANPHRIQAYRFAAQTVRHASRPVAEILDTGGLDALRTMPGIGESLAARIACFVHTGRLALVDPLPGPVSPAVLFARIPGIGPELGRRIHETLQVTTLEDLFQTRPLPIGWTVPTTG